MATPIEPPEDPPAPRRPWGARTNRTLIVLLGVWTLWTLVKSLGDGLIAVPIAIAAFAVAVVGMLAIETVVLIPLRRFPSLARRPAVALAIVVVAVTGTVLRELGVVTIDMQSAHFSTTYVGRARVDGPLQAMPFAFACEIRCHGEDVCDAMGDTITAACSSTAPNRIVIELWVDDPSCYTPLVKSFSTSFIAQATVSTSRLRFDATTRAFVVGVSSCRSARRKAGEVLAQDLLAALAESLEHPEALMWRCADQSMSSTRCPDPWLTP
ncbi:MAG: hypothetical protein ABI591_05585 [Kofleriaceae bacterium]